MTNEQRSKGTAWTAPTQAATGRAVWEYLIKNTMKF